MENVERRGSNDEVQTTTRRRTPHHSQTAKAKAMRTPTPASVRVSGCCPAQKPGTIPESARHLCPDGPVSDCVVVAHGRSTKKTKETLMVAWVSDSLLLFKQPTVSSQLHSRQSTSGLAFETTVFCASRISETEKVVCRKLRAHLNSVDAGSTQQTGTKR